jgi:choline dehydrogenase-like flavoprotein
MGWIKNDALLETGEFQALPKQAQDHIRRKTVPSWEFTALSPVPARVADPTKTYLSISMIGMVTQSCGTVKLASSEPKDPPLCDPQLMTNAFDRRNAIEAIRKMMDFLNVPTLQKDIACPVLMPRSTSDEDIWAYLQENAAPSYHISCTVKMGIAEDPLACVMADFRVRGLESLRVVDMSVAPFLPNCHVQAVAYQIGEMAAEKMIAEYGLS